MPQINFEYGLKQLVKIKALKTKGFVVGYYYGETGIQYQTSYFLNGERKTSYLYAEEISETDDGDYLGFNT